VSVEEEVTELVGDRLGSLQTRIVSAKRQRARAPSQLAVHPGREIDMLETEPKSEGNLRELILEPIRIASLEDRHWTD